MTNSSIRPIRASDLHAIENILKQTELFPSDMLAEMIAPFFDDSHITSYWLTSIQDNESVAFLYCEKERMTVGAWNVLALGVLPAVQRRGIGRGLILSIEKMLCEQGATTLIVETSSLPEYESARRFYEKLGYHQEAIIRDFYDSGENKVIYWKAIV